MREQYSEPAAAAPASSVQAARPVARQLPHSVVWVAVAFAAGGVAVYFARVEGEAALTLYPAAVTFTVAAAIACACGSVLVATVLTTALIGIVHTASYAKQQASEVLLHAYDLVDVLGSWATAAATAAHLWREQRPLLLGLALALAATAAAALVALRLDATRVPRRHAAGAAALLACVVWLADGARGERRHTEYYFQNTYVSFFYSSWAETIEALWRGRLIEAAAAPQGPPLPSAAACLPASKPPHIVLIHQESVTPPAHFPTLSYDRSLDGFFHSFDGKLNTLRVETYGGGSWLTEFSLLTGLSTYSFGGMRQFLQQVMAGKIGDTLPQALARCGYRNVFFYPMLRHFLGSAKFFEAVGLSEIVDAKAQGARRANERDRFYYANALNEIGRHVAASSRPLFVYIQTMAAHGAYDFAYMPEVDVAGGGPGTEPEMHEYLRRLAMVRMDYGFLRTELARRFPGQRFLIVHYGDHQPIATQSLLGFGHDASIEDIMASGNAAARLTYYALDVVHYRPPPLASLDALDVPYLGTVILEAAGLPLSDAYRERRRLMLLCRGRYHDCPARDEVLRFHRRLLDAGLLRPL